MTNVIPPTTPYNTSELLFYQTEDGLTRVEVKVVNDTVWLTQAQMAELFQTTKQNISLHIRNIFEEAELQPETTVKEYLTVQKEGKRQVERDVIYFPWVGYIPSSLDGIALAG